MLLRRRRDHPPPSGLTFHGNHPRSLGHDSHSPQLHPPPSGERNKPQSHIGDQLRDQGVSTYSKWIIMPTYLRGILGFVNG